MRTPWVVGALVGAALLLPLSAWVAFESLPPARAGTAFVLCIVAHVAVVLARQRPQVALLLVAACCGGLALVTGLFFLLPSALSMLAVVFAASAYGDRRAGPVVGLVGAVLATVRYANDASVSAGVSPAPLAVLVLISALVLLAWALGLVQRAQLRSAALLAQLLDQERQQQEDRRARAVAEERARISRDLHDVLAHSLTAVIGQSRVARLEPDSRDRAIDAIEETATSSLAELRSTLRELRDAASVRSPSMARVGELLGQSRAAGVEVTSRVSGRPRELAPAADVALYRVVQEALTNATKHAAGAAVDYDESWHPDRVTVTVRNALTECHDVAVPAGQGLGLVGMSERVDAVGGTVEVRRDTARGMFEVTAQVPVGDGGTR